MWFDIQAANELAKERVERGMRNAQLEARMQGYDQPPRRGFNLLKRLTSLFQRKSVQTPAPTVPTRRRTV